MDSGQSTSESHLLPNPTSAVAGGIGAGLVSPGIDASDGAHALRAGYGSTTNQRGVESGLSSRDMPTLSIPEAVHEEQDDHRSIPSAAVSERSTDSQPRNVDRPKTASSYQHQGPARSGSITEQVIDVNGIRKVVLHTTSTSSSDIEMQGSANKHKFLVRQDGAMVNLDENGNGTTIGSSKKRRRRRKRGSSAKNSVDHGEEEHPLLGHE